MTDIDPAVPAAIKPPAYAVYRSTQDAPMSARTLDGARLELQHINLIAQRTWELGAERTIEDSTGPNGEVVAGGVILVENPHAARGEFRESHEIKGDVWYAKRTKDVN